jgi:hypothetical protein
LFGESEIGVSDPVLSAVAGGALSLEKGADEGEGFGDAEAEAGAEADGLYGAPTEAGRGSTRSRSRPLPFLYGVPPSRHVVAWRTR